MDATLIFRRKFSLELKSGEVVSVFMDLYRLPDGYPKSFPEGYRFSWIAFDLEDKSDKVLLVCHHPKGTHLHIGDDKKGIPYHWTTLDSAYDFFFEQVEKHFGEFMVKEE